MATKLNKPVTREVVLKDIFGSGGEVNVTITSGGVVFHRGRRRFPVIPWSDIAKLATSPGNFPARFSGNPLGWLVELSK